MVSYIIPSSIADLEQSRIGTQSQPIWFHETWGPLKGRHRKIPSPPRPLKRLWDSLFERDMKYLRLGQWDHGSAGGSFQEDGHPGRAETHALPRGLLPTLLHATQDSADSSALKKYDDLEPYQLIKD